MATIYESQVYTLFVGYFGRPPAPSGLAYYTDQMVSSDGNWGIIADDFWNSDESQAIYGGLSVEGQVNLIFQNLFGRDALVEGLNYWAGEVLAGRIALPELAYTIAYNAADADLAVRDAKVESAMLWTESLDTTEEILAFQSDEGRADARDFMSTINTNTPATQGDVDAAIDAMVSGVDDGVFTLTPDADVATANIFDAPRSWTPGGTDQVNTLNDDDQLTGTGTNPTLNFTFVRDADIGGGANTVITPTLSGIETLNTNFAGSTGNYVLDLQDATGLQNLNATRVASGLTANFRNIAEADANTLSVTNLQDPTSAINFTYLDSALMGADDSVDLTLANVNTQNQLRVEGNQLLQGFESMALHSTQAANTVAQIGATSLESAVIDGDQNLTLGGSANLLAAAGSSVVEGTVYSAGFANVTGTLESVDASGLAGALDINLGGEVVSTKAGTPGTQVDFNFVGTGANDTVRLLGGLNAGDTIDMGEGDNNLVIGATAQAGSVSNTDTLTILNQANGANLIGVDTAITSGLTNVVVRNEGQVFAGPPVNANIAAVSSLTTNVVGLTAEAAGNVDILHGTTGNNGLGQNTLQLDVATGVSAVNVELKDAVNTQPRFNFNLYTDSDLVIGANGAVTSGFNNATGTNAVTSLTLVDSDSESNTVALTAQGYTGSGALRADAGTTYTSVSVSGGVDGQFLNLDAGINSYGLNTTGVLGNASSALLSAAPNARDTSFDAVYANTSNAVDSQGANLGSVFTAAGTGASTRLIATTINAGDLASDFVVRVGQADQAITSGAGDDTIIFDAINDNRAGLTIADKVVTGEGKDTVVIDGGFTVLSQTIALGASEWTNLSGVDVLRLGSNSAVGGGTSGYSLVITDQLVDQTDSTSRIAIINNDGDLRTTNTNSVTLDARQANGLSATNFIDFYGENGDSVNGAVLVGPAANRVILSDATANGGHVLNGGDIDLLGAYTDAAWTAAVFAGTTGNNNTIEYRDTSVVTAGDQAGISNFDSIVFNNDQAVLQTLNLELTTAVLDALGDASHTASASQQETITIRADDGAVPTPLAGAALNIDARAASTSFVMNIRSDDNQGANNLGVADTINVVDNVGGQTGHAIDILDGTGNDTLTFYGAAGDVWSAATTVINVAGTTNIGPVTIQNSTGLATAVHNLSWDNGDVIRLTNDSGATFTTLQAAATNLTFNGSGGADTIIGTAGANVITGGAAADSLTGGAGADTFVYAARSDAGSYAGTDVSAANIERITDFAAGGTDDIQLGLGTNAFGAALTFTGATTMTVSPAITLATADYANLAAVMTAVETASAGTASTAATAQAIVFTVVADATTGGDFDSLAAGTYLAINDDTAAWAATDTIINITGATGVVGAGDFVFA